MRAFLMLLISCVFAAALGVVDARAEDAIRRGAAPAWVQPSGDSEGEAAPGELIRAELTDQQFRVDDDGMHLFVLTRAALLSPQAVAAYGAISLPWNPSYQTVTVHAVDILRGDQRIDALGEREFTVLRREEGLEDAMITGILTGTLQLEGLRVGDRVELAYSVTTRIPIFGDHIELMASAASPIPLGRYHLRGSWPSSRQMRWRATDDWATPRITRDGAVTRLELEADDLQPVIVPQNAPVRYHMVRQFQGSDYASWGEVSRIFAPLYRDASTLGPDSPLHEAVARIRAEHPDDVTAQVEAALRLVQDEVRYLALAMGEGGWTPATADETWRRRLGDCKGKTTLLLALLRELGVESQPVLASTVDPDLDRRLPANGVFNHVLVQATVNGRVFWLDGTRSGDRALADIAPPAFGWVLPLWDAADTLIRIEQIPSPRPLNETHATIDLTGGLYVDAPVRGEIIKRGDEAVTLNGQFAAAAQQQRDAYMRQEWEGLLDDLTITRMEHRYDVERSTLTLAMEGTIRMDWTAGGGRRAEVPLSTIPWSAGDRRPEGPYRDVPIVTRFPTHNRVLVTLILPDGGEGFTLDGQDVNAEGGALRVTRATTLQGDRVVMDRTTLFLRPEMTEAERAAGVAPLEQARRQTLMIVAPHSYMPTADDLDSLEGVDQELTAGELITRAFALNSNGRPQEALAAFNRAIELEPTNAAAWSGRGMTRVMQGDVEAAGPDFDKASELNPNDHMAIHGRGMIAMTEERYIDAVVEFSVALRAAPDDPFALAMRASAYLGLKDYRRALADLDRVATLTPGLEADVNRAGVLVEAGRAAEAVPIMDAAAQRDPANVDVRNLQGTIREAAGDLEGAEAAFSEGLAIESDHPVVLIARARVRLLRGDLEGGRADLAAARPSAAGNAGLLNNMCWARTVAGVDLETALADCDAALAARPDDPALNDSRAFALLRLGRAEEAEAAYDKALAAAPDHAASLYGRGLTRRALGRAQEGQADIAAALAISPAAGREFKPYEASLAAAAP